MDLVSTVTTAATLLPLAGQLGQATLDKCVTSFVSSSTSTRTETDAVAFLEDLDIHASLRTARALIRNIRPLEESEDEWEEVNQKQGDDDVVRVCVRHLQASVVQLQKDMDAFDARTHQHHQKWFSSWRRFDATEQLQNMHRHKRLFDLRLNMLLNVVAALKQTGT
jgi:hypothetical protein